MIMEVVKLNYFEVFFMRVFMLIYESRNSFGNNSEDRFSFFLGFG